MVDPKDSDIDDARDEDEAQDDDDVTGHDADERPKPRARASTRRSVGYTPRAAGDDEIDPDQEVERDEPPPRASQPPRGEGGSEHRRDRRESLFRETLRRAVEKSVEAGVETFTRADSAFRGAVGAVEESKLPKEFANLFFSQVDETKNAVVRVVAREVRDFLEATDIADELYRALTSLSFEIKTEIRFIPNETGGVRPDVRAKVAPKRDKAPREGRESRRRESVKPGDPHAE